MKKVLLYGWIIAMLLTLCSCAALDEGKQLIEQAGKNDKDEVVVQEEPEETPDEQEPPTVQTPPAEEQPPEEEAVQVQLDRYTETVTAGSSFQLKATANTNRPFHWSSSDESVALVNSQGNVTGVKAGVANIVCAVDSGIEAVCTVTVKAAQQSQSTPSYQHTRPSAAYDDDFVFPHSSRAYLTRAEVAQTLNDFGGHGSPTGNIAQDAINEIYARNGYAFQKSHIRAFYQKKGWYTINKNFSENSLNAYEKKNIALLKEFV